MEPPDELMMQTFLPAMRQLVAVQLHHKGYSQTKISTLMGITQASVSLYISYDPKRAYSSLSHLYVTQPEADRYATLLAGDIKNGAADGVRTLSRIWEGLLGLGSVCPAHRSQYPNLADCDVCIKAYGQPQEARSVAIAEVTEAVRTLEASPTFTALIPEVSINIACLAGEVDDPDDVIAIPGRIVRVGGKPKAVLPPEAGASDHVSRVLLLVRKVQPGVRACINLRYDNKVAKAIKGLGLRALNLGSYSLPGAKDPTINALERRLKVATQAFDVVIDPGGKGIEPNIYVFGKGAREVADIALRVSEEYALG